MILLFDTLRDLWRLLDARGRWLAGLLVLLLMISGALEMGALVFLFGFVKALSAGADPAADPIVEIYRAAAGDLEGAAFVLAAGLLLIGVFLLKNLFGLGTGFFLMRFSMKRYEKIATRLFRGFLAARYDRFVARGAMQPQQILGSVAGVFRTSFTPALEALSDIAIFLTMIAALLFVLDPALVLAAGIVLGGGGALFLYLTRRLSMELGRRRMAADQLLQRTMVEGFRGLIDTRLGHRQEAVLGRYARVAGESALADRRARALDRAPRALNEMVLACGIVLAAFYFAQEEGGMAAALSSLAVLGFAGLRMTGALSRLANALQRMRENAPQRERLMAAILETAPTLLYGSIEPADDYQARDRPLPAGVSGRLERALALRGVHFTYPGADRPAIENVSLAIPRGALVGLCGPSGGGKSTLALIMMGLLEPQQGRVLCDGWDVFKHISAWHRNLGYVSQTPFLTPASVRRNVAFGYEDEEIDDERVWRALETAALAEVVRARPGGLDASLGDEGSLISGGQRQRLAIARALYRDPEVLFLDEATAALDTETEREITAAVNRLSGERTVICIAHRLSTIREADVIHVLEAGRIVASGTYDELEAASPAFRRIASGQVRAA